ncbi:MAG: hypothetical protein WC130_03710 [Kiritimatiellia bacterium]
MTPTFTQGKFLIAVSESPQGTFVVDGYVSDGGIGLHHGHNKLAADLGLTQWNITHLNTGHRIATIFARQDIEAMELGDKILAAGDWSFTSLNGWENTDPGLIERVFNIVYAYPNACMGGGQGKRGEEIARKIAYGRMN